MKQNTKNGQLSYTEESRMIDAPPAITRVERPNVESVKPVKTTEQAGEIAIVLEKPVETAAGLAGSLENLADKSPGTLSAEEAAMATLKDEMDQLAVATAQELQDVAVEDVPDIRKKIEEEHLRLELKEAGKLGRGIFQVAADREYNRFPSYLETRKFSKDDLAAISEGRLAGPITETDITQTRNASLRMFLEAATQIVEVQLPRTGGMREAPKSLDSILTLIKQGGRQFSELAKEDPSLVVQLVKDVMSRRPVLSPQYSAVSNDKAFIAWGTNQIDNAGSRIFRAKGFLVGYQQVRLR